uniref:Uncharacterized protein n=1 Tax=Tanacetum cinerariifolium TaxID=118510 RepID=A0A699IKI0_TANCI|nr:hypothetical protein [Tanacetum cinerariifolium]
MMTVRKRVRTSPTHRLAARHSVAYSSLDHFALDDSLGDSSSTPSSGMRPSHHLCSLVSSIPHSSAAIIDRPSRDSSYASPSSKSSRSPAASVPLSSPFPGALSYARADLLPSPKRIRSSEFATDLKIDLEIQAEIDECIAYEDAIRDRGIDARVVVEAVDREEIEMGARGPIVVRVDRVSHPEIADDIPEPA